MNRSSTVLVVVAIIVIMGIAAYALTQTTSTPLTSTTTTTPSTTTTTTPAASAVSIQNFSFNPDSITVNSGTMVTWTNNDSTTHTVTSTGGPKSFSGELIPGQTFSYTFYLPGTYTYQCSIHTYMTGTVVVLS